MKLEDIQGIGVIGSGIMGIGVAQGFAEAGIPVLLVDRSQEILEAGMKQIEGNLGLFQEFGLLNEDPDVIKSRITPSVTDDFGEIADRCSFVVEAIPEILELKREWFGKLDDIDKEVIFASNTSSFTVSAISDGIQKADRIVGLHYFNPAHIIPAVEIHRGKQTSEETVQLTKELMLKIGKKPVLVRKEVPGFIINRITGAMEREIDYLLDEGVVTPEDLDTAIRASYGFRLANLGPMEAEDMIGLDTSERVSANIFKVLSNRTEPSPSITEKVKKGELGIKSGKGWYDYSGQTSEEIASRINTRLLKQLAHFRSLDL